MAKSFFCAGKRGRKRSGPGIPLREVLPGENPSMKSPIPKNQVLIKFEFQNTKHLIINI
jgi:hypothetical protein